MESPGDRHVMSVDIGAVIEEGGRRTIARNGLYFVAIVWVLSVLSGLFTNTVTRQIMENVPGPGPGQAGGPFGPSAVGPSLGISPSVAGLLSLVIGLLSLVVTAAAIRTFVTQETETIPGEFFTRNLLWMVLNLIVGGILFAIVVGIGLVLLVVPGLFLLVSLFFWNTYVIVEDENFVEGFSASWALTSGDRIALFLLGVVVAVVVIVIGVVFGVVSAVLPGIVGLVVSQLGSAFAGVFTAAATARAFVQLRAEEPTAA
jgi:hypothetical protein